MSRPKLALLVLLALALCAVPAVANAATLAVDDDGAQCPAAQFDTIQAAVDAAAPGDTVAICPGVYVEGSGAVGTGSADLDPWPLDGDPERYLADYFELTELHVRTDAQGHGYLDDEIACYDTFVAPRLALGSMPSEPPSAAASSSTAGHSRPGEAASAGP